MKIAYGISWSDSKRNQLTAVLMASILALSLFSATAQTSSIPSFSGPTVSVIVRDASSSIAAEQVVKDLGGKVGRQLGIIDGFVAEIPVSQLDRLRSSEAISSVSINAKLEMLSFKPDHVVSRKLPGSMHNTGVSVGADRMWDRGITGAGVDIALVDTGVVPVEGLRTPGKIVNGADVSFEAGASNLRHLDTYGHGTHMAGIMAGLDSGVSPGGYDSHANFVGIAPEARVINVKVANALGATDVSQVIAAIDWVVQHRNDNGMNIRIMNLSFGTDGVQDYTLDPLAFAAEVAWHKGIVVVVAAGNHGYGTKKLNNPAYDPYVIAVGAVDSRGTASNLDDRVPGWSSQGDGERNPDLVAPGKSIVSLRAPGSYVDQMSSSEGIVNERFVKGSGTSQAAAVTSGAAALLLDARPGLTPDQVKALLTSTARPVPVSSQQAQGAGIIDPATAAVKLEPSSAVQTFARATGTGTIEGARGSAHVLDDGRELVGEIDVFGNSWSGNSWSGNSWSGNSWSGGTWSGNSWSGNSWSGGAWMGSSWSGNSWSGNSWSGNSWSGNSWSGNSWSGNSWSGNSWSGNSWSAGEWN